MLFVGAFVMGLMGSLHCLGMCGPIVMAIPFSHDPVDRFFGTLTYNLGRVITYSIIGFFFGLFGMGLAMGGFQQTVSIVLGAIMLLSVFFPFLFRRIRPLEKILLPINNFVKQKLSGLIQNRTYPGLLLTGILNGLLPCGLVYAAVAGAIASGSVVKGVLFMATFGLGTIPLMAALPMLGSLGGIKFRRFYRKALPSFVIVLGILFILRGMGLGIKYISPKLNGGHPTEQPSCH